MLRKRFSILQKYCCEHPQRPPRKRDSAFPYSEANVSLDKEESLQQGPLFSPTPQKLALSLAEAVKRKFFSFNRPGFTYGLCGRLTILGLWNCPDPACFQAKMPHQIGHIWKTTTATPFLLDRSHRFSPPAPEKWWCWTARKRQAMKTENVAYKTPGAWCCAEQDWKDYRAKGTDEYREPLVENS